MITTGFILIAQYLVNLVIAVFPTSSGFPVEVSNSIATMSSYIGIFTPIFPYNTIGSVLVLLLSFELIIFSFKTFKWIISHIPQIGGRG